MQETWEIGNHTLEFLEDEHIYLCDGVILPSITNVLKIKFGNKYAGVSKEVLEKAAIRGTQVHQAIEDYEKKDIYDMDCVELRNYKFLKKSYKFECLDNEVPVILFKNDIPVACGRLDLVLEEDGKIGLGDIKRTSTLDKEYLAYQLNLYRIAYQQCYGKNIEFLRGLHLRNNIRKYINIPINENVALSLLNEFLEGEENG